MQTYHLQSILKLNYSTQANKHNSLQITIYNKFQGNNATRPEIEQIKLDDAM